MQKLLKILEFGIYLLYIPSRFRYPISFFDPRIPTLPPLPGLLMRQCLGIATSNSTNYCRRNFELNEKTVFGSSWYVPLAALLYSFLFPAYCTLFIIIVIWFLLGNAFVYPIFLWAISLPLMSKDILLIYLPERIREDLFNQ